MPCKSVCEIGLAGANPAEGVAGEDVAVEGPAAAVPLGVCGEGKIADTMFPSTLIYFSCLLLVPNTAIDFN
jgi:hypothetical protein